MREGRSGKPRQPKLRKAGDVMMYTVMLFFFLAFLLLALKDFAISGIALAFVVPLCIYAGTYGIARLFPTDRLILALTHFLCAMGILILYATNRTYAYHQAIYYVAGLLGMLACVYAVRTIHDFSRLVWPIAVLSLALMALPLVVGREINGARNWIYIGSISLQPSELCKVTLMIVLATFMRKNQMIPWLLFSIVCLGILMLQKDLGTALLYYGVTLVLFFISSGNLPLTGLGLAGGAGAAYLGYTMFAHVRRRVAIWKNPWADYDNAGYQIVQGLMALASGRWLGMGLGLGSPTTIPVYETDFIFAVICEQFGLVVGVCVLLMYVALIWRGTEIAMAARSSFHALLCMGATCLLGLQTFVIIGGVLKLIPLTGVTMPFVSHGGSSLLTSMCLVGLILGVASFNEEQMQLEIQMALRSA